MNFITDKQTLDDLNILGRFKNSSIARLFDHAITAGGKRMMDNMFQYPLVDEHEINKRSSIFKYFTNNSVTFPFESKEFEVMENYLGSGGGNLASIAINTISKKALQIAAQDTEYELLRENLSTTITLIERFYNFLNSIQDDLSPLNDQLKHVEIIFKNPKLTWIFNKAEQREISIIKVIKYDYLLRSKLHVEVQEMIEIIFRLDVYIAVASVARNRGFCFAKAFARQTNQLTVSGLFHPAVKHAIGNNLALDKDLNVVFLTGANMAGKSTLMKSFGIAVYMAHMGFPIAANHMDFSVKDGLYSSINISDNLEMGFSHFYAEVLRVKTVALEVAAEKDIVVIFDELFKGTNVKDAYDATFTLTEAFAENRSCFFMISTHIVEVAESLKKYNNFSFVYLPTIMDGLIPRYTYKLTEGITADKHGMMIIENEGILDIIKSGIK
ncbi:MAG: DNA mismatch repair protein [Bacteroidota bacterium]